MDELIERAVNLLKTKPGLTRERLAGMLNVENTDDLRLRLSDACDRKLMHKIHDKYYPGGLDSY